MRLTKFQEKLQAVGVPDHLVKLRRFPRKAKVKFLYKDLCGRLLFEGILVVDGVGIGRGLSRQVGYVCTHCHETSGVSDQGRLFTDGGGGHNMPHTWCNHCGKENTISPLCVQDVAEVVEIYQEF